MVMTVACKNLVQQTPITDHLQGDSTFSHEHKIKAV